MASNRTKTVVSSGSWAFEVPWWAFAVFCWRGGGKVVIYHFVGLARLIFFDSRWACVIVIFVSELRFRSLLLGFRSFLFGRCEGKSFVELARLIVLFHVGLAQFFYWSCAFGVSRWAFVVFCLSGGRGIVALSSRGYHNCFVWFCWACAIFCLAFAAFCLSGGSLLGTVFCLGMRGFFCLAFAFFLFERREGGIFVGLVLLAFCFASGLRSFSLELGF